MPAMYMDITIFQNVKSKIDISDIGNPPPDHDFDVVTLPVKYIYEAYNSEGFIFFIRHMTLS